MAKLFSKKKDPLYIARCVVCNKKIFTPAAALRAYCKCEKFYCYKHQFPEDHNCTFDYKSEGIEELKKKLPLIVADKVPNRI